MLNNEKLQQHLPFTVLKRSIIFATPNVAVAVATALTVYGIETFGDTAYSDFLTMRLQQHLPFTVLKHTNHSMLKAVNLGCNSTYRLRY